MLGRRVLHRVVAHEIRYQCAIRVLMLLVADERVLGVADYTGVVRVSVRLGAAWCLALRHVQRGCQFVAILAQVVRLDNPANK